MSTFCVCPAYSWGGRTSHFVPLGVVGESSALPPGFCVAPGLSRCCPVRTASFELSVLTFAALQKGYLLPHSAGGVLSLSVPLAFRGHQSNLSVRRQMCLCPGKSVRLIVIKRLGDKAPLWNVRVVCESSATTASLFAPLGNSH